MLSLTPSTRFWGLPCGIPRFWRLRVAKDFPKPEYYIGQTVMYCCQLRDKQFCVYVDVLGIASTGTGWQYMVNLPESHPWFEVDDREIEWVDSKELKLPFDSVTSEKLIESVGAQQENLISQSVGALTC
jgi:hypothetical protein